MTNYFSNNLKFLRKQKGLTQKMLSELIGVNRPKLGSYEEGRAEPNLSTLQHLSQYFDVAIDDFIEKDLSLNDESKQKKAEGSNLRVLPILVDDKQNERISMIGTKAAAGYLNGYSDPEYIEDQPNFALPMSEFSQGTFRAFQINGDSMLPIKSGSYVLAEYLENWTWIKDGECYIVVSKNDGIVYKRLINSIDDKSSIELNSDNPSFDSYQVDIEDILEVWKAKAYLSFDLPDKADGQLSVNELSQMMSQLKSEVDHLKKNS